jgi:hypothetical protein
VDAKKRELVGLFKNHGRAWRKTPLDVGIYDFPGDADGVAIPYGIYDVTRGDGFVVVGTSHNTHELLILADSGSSNGARAHAWKADLQQIANRAGLRITVAHYPTAASKWNPIKHRLFGLRVGPPVDAGAGTPSTAAAASDRAAWRLQGMLICGRCASRLTVSYGGSGGRYPTYVCRSLREQLQTPTEVIDPIEQQESAPRAAVEASPRAGALRNQARRASVRRL